jgi:hypothetical protein
METQSQKKLLPKGVILKVGLIFIISFCVFLAGWLVVKGYYGEAITTVSSYAAAAVKNAQVVDITRDKDVIQVGFIPETFGVAQVYKTSIEVPVSNYAFNVPLTLAIMAAFFPFLRSRRVYIEALIILVFVHFLFIFTLEGERLTGVFVSQGYEKESTVSNIFWQFSWGFLDNMVVRFEPFLIGAYLFFSRNRVPAAKQQRTKEKKGINRQRPGKSKGKKSRKK